MPAEGVALTPKESLLSLDELYRLARIFIQHNGVRKVRLTGGEPLVRRDIVDIVRGIRDIQGSEGGEIGMTTNGVVFHQKAKELKAAGLQLINISLDTFDPFKFELISRRPASALKNVLRSIETAVELNFKQVKVNCVIIRGVNDDEIRKFVEFTKEKQVTVRFIEYMPFDGNKWNNSKFMSYKEMMSVISDLPLERAEPDSTSKVRLLLKWQNFRVSGWQGQVGFISSMSDHFCGTCNRLRLTADGNLKVCLFGRKELSLRDLMRSGCTDQQIQEAIEQAVLAKKASHDGMMELSRRENRPMILIGG